MGIVDEDVVRAREAADIVAVVQAFTQLKRVGRRWVGLCPFHGEKTPSFSVNQERGLWYCFGCQAKGDVITFVRDMEHLDFVGAVEWLAARTGITLRYTDRNEGEGRKQRARLIDAMRAALDWYHDRLLTGADAGTARRYLRERGIDGEIVRRYQIGWAPDEWDALVRSLKLPDKIVQDAGLGFVNKRNRMQDFFRGRILFPIFDAQGDPVAFGGRKLPSDDGPKYRNTPETRLYSKSKVLYGLNWSKEDIVQSGEVIVCEGYTDVIGFAQAGLPRAVATCGTALTEEHVRLMKRFAPRVVLAFDPDAAGQAAADRFYEWEHRHEIDVAVADLPAGMDPSDLARRDPHRLGEAINKATPFLGFRIERILAGAKLSSPEGRARAAEAALGAIGEHPSELVRDQYLMQVADRCRVEPDRLRASLRAGDPVRISGPSVRPNRRARDTPETEALRLAVQQPATMLELLDDVLFDDDHHLSAFRLLREAQGDVHRALDVADPGAAELLQRLAVEETDADPTDVRRVLLREKAVWASHALEIASREADDFAAYSSAIGWLKLQIEKVQPDAPPDPVAEDELLAWLVTRAEDAPHDE
ncbi:MAG: DNA primase [Actinomycetota bacterium]|nr:DNA primase [Actinomycetota bacterium]